jgi:predicted MFS family arabinose efflux permease
MRRPVVLLLYLALFVGEVMWTAIVPLVPAFSQRFGLSAFQAGLLLASTSIAILLVSIPAGIVVDRLGARRMTIAAVAVMAVGDLGQGLAGGFWPLIGARTLFGVGFGVLWTTGIAWLSDAVGDRNAQALSLTVTTAGLGGVAGPAFAGVLVDRAGLGAPFFISAAASAVLALSLVVESSGSGRAAASGAPVRGVLRAAGGERRILASLTLMTLGGFMGGAVNLLVPLQLHANGLSTGSIGLAFAVSAGIFLASSAAVARLGERAARIGVGAAATACATLALLLLVSHSTVAQVAFLQLRAPFTATMFTITFPLAVIGARVAGIGVGAVAALLNIVWASSVLVAPLAAGGIQETAGSSAAYALVLAVSAAVTAWLATGARHTAMEPELSAGD